jgi:hypothetical protein
VERVVIARALRSNDLGIGLAGLVCQASGVLGLASETPRRLEVSSASGPTVLILEPQDRDDVCLNTLTEGSFMEKIIDVDFHLIWTSPVFLRLGEGLRERIDGPDAALAQLHNRWPPDSHPEYAAAKRRCVDAITRRGSSELARAAFIEAAALAKVLS